MPFITELAHQSGIPMDEVISNSMVKTPTMTNPRKPRQIKIRDIDNVYGQCLGYKDASNPKSWLRRLRAQRRVAVLPTGKSRFIKLKKFYKDERTRLQVKHHIFIKHFPELLASAQSNRDKSISSLVLFYLKARRRMIKRVAAAVF